MTVATRAVSTPEDEASPGAPSASAAKPSIGARVLCQALERERVEVIFGYPGGAVIPLYDVLPEFGIHHVLVRHEQGAAPCRRRLRPRHRQGGRLPGDLRARRDQPGHRHRHGDAGLRADGRDHRPGRPQP